MVSLGCPHHAMVGKELLNHLKESVHEFHRWACPGVEREGGAVLEVVGYEPKFTPSLGGIQQLKCLQQLMRELSYSCQKFYRHVYR